MISMWVSRFRIKERPPHRGLISAEQVEELRAELRPGDILIERRNWYISNSLLPGFWPHAALYLGSYEELLELGVAADPRAAPHMSDFQGQNELGDSFAVLEAIGEGVIFTSFEQSVGEADAVAVLRPNLSEDELRDALSRALSHRGKEYDFDFDFATTDKLVCTELIFRTYDPVLDIPLRDILGKPRIAASDFVRMWADGLESDVPPLELIRFLDFDEAGLVADELDEVPGLAAVRGFVQPSLRIGIPDVTQGSNVHDVGVRGVHDDPGDDLYQELGDVIATRAGLRTEECALYEDILATRMAGTITSALEGR